MRKSQELAEKSGLEHPCREIDPSVQDQTQSTVENHVREQLMSEQRKGISVPQVSQKTNTGIEQGRNTMSKYIDRPQVTEVQTPFYPDPLMKPPPRLPDKIVQNNRQINLDLDMEINKDFEENSPNQEGIISEIYQRPEKSQLVEPPELVDLIHTEKIVQKYLAKQTDIDKILKDIQRKVLKGTHLLDTIKEIQAVYLNSPYFKDLYLYLSQNKLPSTKSTVCKIETLAERYILLDSLLFKLNLEKEKAVLATPEACVDQIIAIYHSSLCAGHQGVVKTYLTMADKFFIPYLTHYLCSYIKGCHICQLSKKDKIPNRQFQTRINLNYKPLSRLTMDLKVMLKSHQGHKFILCVIDEMTNYLITMPIHQARSEEIGDALIDNVISKYEL